MDPEHLRELAAGRLREQRRIDAAARLSDAQRMIASEHGFPSWPRMKAYADRIAAHPGGVQLAYHADLDYYAERAYRPHSGFPAWAPTDDPQEVLDEALAYASRNDRVQVLDTLVDHGARLEADVYRGTPLIWAASRGRSAAAERLLALGADPMGRGS